MTIVHYTNSVSAHQLPLDYELVKLVGAENFRYIYTNETLQGGAQEVAADDPWVVPFSSVIEPKLLNCELLIVGGIRPIELMERRLAAGKATFYMSERWFKPFLKYLRIPFFDFDFELRLPGSLRLFHPRYYKMARRFVRLFESPHYRFLPIGPHSARDMRLLCRVLGKSKFGVEVEERNNSSLGLGLNTSTKFIPWGDFVAPSEKKDNSTLGLGLSTSTKTLRALWVGRMLKLKHVETIIRAVVGIEDLSLTLVGDGPEKEYLQRLAVRLGVSAEFRPAVSLAGVREVMRQHDIFVFSSNGYDGWGAVVPEAMTEGMTVLGTYEAGASAALLPKENLFHCGDWRTLAKMLTDRSYKPTPLPYDYTPEGAAKRLLREFDKLGEGER